MTVICVAMSSLLAASLLKISCRTYSSAFPCCFLQKQMLLVALGAAGCHPGREGIVMVESCRKGRALMRK